MLDQSVKAQFAADSGREVCAENCAQCYGVRLMANADLALAQEFSERRGLDGMIKIGVVEHQALVPMSSQDRAREQRTARRRST